MTMHPPRVLALILSRAGSKGCPGKNTALVAGRPCISWTLDAARDASLVTDIAVTSDDPKALALARDAGIVALQRPAHLAADTARVDDAARQALLAWESLHPTRTHADIIIILYANAPIRPANLINDAVQRLRDTNAHSVQSYTPVGKHHPWWEVRIDPEGNVTPWEGPLLNHGVFRRQDLPPAFIPDGGVLALTRPALMLEIPGMTDHEKQSPHAFFGTERRAVLTPHGSVVDIDTPIDLIVADTILRQRGADVAQTQTTNSRAA